MSNCIWYFKLMDLTYTLLTSKTM